MIRKSLELQAEAIEAHKPDVVIGPQPPPPLTKIGSSYGGGIAVLALQYGIWSGPTVLLCPAYKKLCDRAHMEATPLAAAGCDRPWVAVVHGDADQDVPLEHSRHLVDGCTLATLRVVADNHRLERHAPQMGEWVRAAHEEWIVALAAKSR
jgi:hypothetical protein